MEMIKRHDWVSWKKEEGEEFLVNFSMECIEEHKEQEMDLVKDVLKHFGEIFQASHELLPNRTQDHTICLKEGATVPNFSPYRYHIPIIKRWKLKSW